MGARLLVTAASAVALVGLAATPAASADTCSVTVTSRASGDRVFSYPALTVPASATSPEALLAVLIAKGSVPAAADPTSTYALTDSCSGSSSATTSPSTTTASTSSSTTTAPPTTTSTTTTPAGTAPTTTAPPSTTSSTSTTRSGSTTSTTTTRSTSSTTTSSTTTGSTSTTAAPGAPRTERQSSRPGARTRPARPRHRSSRHRSPRRRSHARGRRHRHAASTTPRAHLPHGKGVPSPSNPTFSLALPGAPAIGVPNFFIDSFQIPPFLLPIYQAAGIEYQVPWQVLAAINQVETDYGRNLSVSSAGAVGWMQFMPATWKRWGVDANGDGVADPYNPVDAIFSAARYLHAAGASENLARAIFAYNHAGWYVQEVLLLAKLIGGMPSTLVGALTGLVQGHFPVAAPAKYADETVVSLARRRVRGSSVAEPVDSNPHVKGTAIFARRGSPVIAVNDGKIVALGSSASLGRYITLQDATGNTYTYAHLGRVSRMYASPKPVRITPADVAAEMATPRVRAPSQAASAGSHLVTSAAATRPASAGTSAASAGPGAATTARAKAHPGATSAKRAAAPMVKERLFAHPARRASWAAGGNLQLRTAAQPITSFDNYFADTLHLARGQYTLRRLRVGSIVIAGTILGRIGGPTQGVSSHLFFQIRPAGRGAPAIDPKPILDGWKLLQATAVYRANGVDPFYGPGAKNPSVGQVLLMSKQQLTTRVLADPHVRIYACGRRDIQAGLIDRRVLAVMEFLSASGLDPTISGLACDSSATGATGVDAAGRTGESVDISQINGVPILGHQGPGSITDVTIRRLLTLQGSMAPNGIVSDMTYKDQANTVALPDHANRIQVSYARDYGANAKLSNALKSLLAPGQWGRLIDRISQIPEPLVPISPSRYAIRDPRSR